jgi:hypothetical protein
VSPPGLFRSRLWTCSNSAKHIEGICQGWQATKMTVSTPPLTTNLNTTNLVRLCYY